MISVGDKFNMLTVLEKGHKKNGKSASLCKCDCGKIVIVRNDGLQNGHTKSCGCYRDSAPFKHGGYSNGKEEKLLHVWRNIHDRCFNKNNKKYNRYGGRGIGICDQWRNNYVAFRDWALSHGYVDGLTIDRIDNDKGYSPDNCRWVDYVVQNNNRCCNVFLTYNGVTMTIAQWAEVKGINKKTLGRRIWQGWSAEKALTYKRK